MDQIQKSTRNSILDHLFERIETEIGKEPEGRRYFYKDPYNPNTGYILVSKRPFDHKPIGGIIKKFWEENNFELSPSVLEGLTIARKKHFPEKESYLFHISEGEHLYHISISKGNYQKIKNPVIFRKKRVTWGKKDKKLVF